MKITYLDHSGFAVECGDTLLVFDEYNPKPAQGKSGLAGGVVTEADVLAHAHSALLLSHSHSDHYCKEVLTLPFESTVLSPDFPKRLSGTRLAEGEASRPAFCLSVVVRGGFTRSFRAIGDSGFLRQHLIGLVHQALLSTLMPRCVPPANDRYVFEGQRYSQMPQPLQRVESTMGRPDASAESAS